MFVERGQCKFTYVFILQNVSLSVNDLLSCCGFMCGDGCDGGYPLRAWQYFVQNGIVTDEVTMTILNGTFLMTNPF